MANIEHRLSKVETKLDGVATDITAGKATFDTLKWVLGVVGAICAALLAAILGVLVNHFTKH